MTATLERLTNEVRQLSSSEVAEFRDWMLEFAPSGAESVRRGSWKGHADRMKEIFGDDLPARENTVLALRAEERF